jgi:hypothetical protein
MISLTVQDIATIVLFGACGALAWLMCRIVVDAINTAVGKGLNL